MAMDCRHQHARLVRITASDGSERFACKCVLCGRMATRWLPHQVIIPETKPEDENSKPPTIQQLLEEERTKMRIALQEAKAAAYQLRRTFYDNYLKSPQWQAKREAVRQRCEGVCERCHFAKMVDTHHLNYERLGNEAMEDLLGVCRRCHEELHRTQLEKACA